jgi:predicted kinase
MFFYFYNLLFIIYKFIHKIFLKPKYLYILRGLPGSGKTTYINNFLQQSNINNYSIHNFEDFYKDNPREISKCYSDCLGNFISNLYLKTEYIFIDNPNIQYWEYENYIILGKAHNYKIVIIDIECPDIKYIDLFKERCNTNKGNNFISRRNILNMYERWEENYDSYKIEPYIEMDLILHSNN